MSLTTKATVLAAAAAIGLALAGPASAHDGSRHDRDHRGTNVKAPGTSVKTRHTRRGTDVRVRAPHTRVHVDTERRVVRIRVPYFNQDIRW